MPIQVTESICGSAVFVTVIPHNFRLGICTLIVQCVTHICFTTSVCLWNLNNFNVNTLVVGRSILWILTRIHMNTTNHNLDLGHGMPYPLKINIKNYIICIIHIFILLAPSLWFPAYQMSSHCIKVPNLLNWALKSQKVKELYTHIPIFSVNRILPTSLMKCN